MTNQILLWIIFNAFVIGMLVLDLSLVHRKQRIMGYKEAFGWSLLWITLALIFCLGIYFSQGSETALNFLTGYLIEKALSVDNLFVFLMIFTYFCVPPQNLHKVLFFGVLGALVMRAIFIFAGVVLINKFHWMIYLFGAFLVIIGLQFLWKKEQEIKAEKSIIIRLLHRFVPFTDKYDGDRFFIKQHGRYLGTPLFAALLAIEISDIIFAIDSVPAILAITTDPFIVYSSNVFAILGLRALYFALSGFMQALRFLHYGLAALLIFIGIKMMLTDYIHISVTVTLSVVVGILMACGLASYLFPKVSA